MHSTVVSQNFSCSCCKIFFTTSEEQRTHYKSEWHRYNLKRKTAGLESACKEDFESKSIYYQSLGIKNGSDHKGTENTFQCPHCTLSFNSEKRLENHLRSGKHDHLMPNSKNVDIDDNDFDDVDIEVITDPLICTFCPHTSMTVSNNVEHMTKTHNFFIPDAEHLKDLTGLVTFCSYKVKLAQTCLYCDAEFNSLGAVQKHMVSKGHTMIGDNDMDDICTFFDFRQSDDDDVEMDEGSLGQAAIIAEDETELVFPNGKRVGHRAFHRFYKQNLIYRPMRQAPSIQWKEEDGQITTTEEHLGKHEKKDDRAWLRKVALRMLKVGVSGNKLQKYFRYQIR